MTKKGGSANIWFKTGNLKIRSVSVSSKKRVLLPVGAGLAGAILLTAVYFGIVSLAESPQHAIELFLEDRLIVIPIILGFGAQLGLYTVLKKRLFVPVASVGPSGALPGAGGPPPRRLWWLVVHIMLQMYYPS